MGDGASSGSMAPEGAWPPHRPDGSVAPGWYFLPLRLFLGVTFLFAGLQKLANSAFLRASNPSSIHAQLLGASRSSPIHALVAHLVPIASTVGLIIAIGEVAIGLGVVLGLWTRVAAIAGMALSFGLFLTVSFHASPYFTGSDIVFFFAWTPLALAGAGGAPALDTWLADQSAAGPAPAGAIPRREVVSKGAITGIVAAVVLFGSGIVAALGRIAGGTTTSSGPTDTLGKPSGRATSTTTTGGGTTPTTAPPSGTAVGAAASVPVGGSAAFTDPASGDPALVIQQTAGDFVAFDAVCPHAGCTVAYQPSAKIIACPCHGSEFNARTGAVIRGPATFGLTSIKVIRGANGNLYVPS
ncbi:MAG: Rieske 2Fe-2S domain-containing protein [Acidimicrobiales bacterium]